AGAARGNAARARLLVGPVGACLPVARAHLETAGGGKLPRQTFTRLYRLSTESSLSLTSLYLVNDMPSGCRLLRGQAGARQYPAPLQPLRGTRPSSSPETIARESRPCVNPIGKRPRLTHFPPALI